MAGLKNVSRTVMQRFIIVMSFILGIGGSTIVALGSLHTSGSPHTHMVVTGGSMEPAIGVREVITIDPHIIPAVGDVITFLRHEQLITHRIIRMWSGTDPSGRTRQLFTTQGDANSTVDPWTVVDDDIVGTVVPTPAMMSMALWLSMRPTLLAAMILPMLLALLVTEIQRIRKWKLYADHDVNLQHSQNVTATF